MYKKLALCLLSAIIGCGNLLAHTLTSDEALQNALSKLTAGTSVQKAMMRGDGSMQLSHTQLTASSVPLYYVYDMPQGGFLIAGADTRSHGLLGYTDRGSYSDTQRNPSFLGWLAECQDALTWLSTQPEGPALSVQRTASASATSVEPLLGNTQWDQFSPYNLLCPTLEEGVYPVGCVAVAMAQVMKYYKWPDCGEGSHTNANFASQSVDFSQSVYDWDNMLDNYAEVEYTETQAIAVAKLMADAGCALDMQYKIGGSSSYLSFIANVLATYFKYDKGMEFHHRTYYNSEEWNALLKKELNELRPVCMGADTNYGYGHAFVIDGYDSNGLYHVNWGMGGWSDGYFSLDYMSVDGYPGVYSCIQQIITNIKPDKSRTSVAHSFLSLETNIDYDNNEFYYRVCNCGLADFTGSVGFVLKNDKDEIIHESWVSCAENPLQIYPDYRKCSYIIPESISIKSGYTVTPVYKQAEDQEIHTLRGRLTGANKLIAEVIGKKITWEPDQAAYIKYLDSKVYPLYKGDSPKVTVSVKNVSDVEYNESVYALIRKDNLCYGQGRAQLFLQPGDTITVTIDCVLPYGDLSYMDLEVGKYDIILGYEKGGIFYSWNAAKIVLNVEEPKASDITYSDFALNDSVYVRGDTIVATFKAVNKGGHSYQNYDFWIQNPAQADWVACYSASNVFIPENDSVIVTITGVIDLEPGNYAGGIYQDGWISYSDQYEFRVTDSATGIRSVEDTAASSVTLDLYGRKADQVKPGQIYIRNGKKVMNTTFVTTK